jgi:RNA methyltransferase, TrmH family
LITSPHNEKLKLIRKLRERKHRYREGLFVAEGEDLVEMATAAGWEPLAVLRAGKDIEPGLLDEVSELGSGTRVIGVYRQRWVARSGSLSVYLHGIGDPGNVGTLIRIGHALADGPIILGPRSADPYSPKAVRASMGSIFARPPARGRIAELGGRKLALDPRADGTIDQVELKPPLLVLAGAEREGLPAAVLGAADARARIPIRPDGPDSLNVAVAAAVALYELRRRMARHV